MKRFYPPGFVELVDLLKKDWDGPDPWDRLNAEPGDPSVRLTREEIDRWHKHIKKVGPELLPTLSKTNPSAARCLETFLENLRRIPKE